MPRRIPNSLRHARLFEVVDIAPRRFDKFHEGVGPQGDVRARALALSGLASHGAAVRRRWKNRMFFTINAARESRFPAYSDQGTSVTTGIELISVGRLNEHAGKSQTELPKCKNIDES